MSRKRAGVQTSGPVKISVNLRPDTHTRLRILAALRHQPATDLVEQLVETLVKDVRLPGAPERPSLMASDAPPGAEQQ